jgi:hypothetical protein
MAKKVSSRNTDIAIPAKKIDISEIISFDNRCIDPFAALVVTEALDYALEKAEKRLDNMQSVFPSAHFAGSVQDTLGIMEGILDSITRAPRCSAAQKKPLIGGFEPKTKTQAPSASESIIPKGQIELPEERKRTVPERWTTPITFEGKKYESPTDFAREMKFTTTHARNIIDAFNDAGYKVYDGQVERTAKNPGSKSVGEFRIVRTGPTPGKLRTTQVEPRPQEPLPPKTVGLPRGLLTIVKDSSGKFLRIEQENGTEYIPPVDQAVIAEALKRLPSDYNPTEVFAYWAKRTKELTEGAKQEPKASSGKLYEVTTVDDLGTASTWTIVETWHKGLPANYISRDSMIGKALYKKRPGDKVELNLSTGKRIYTVKTAMNFEE